MIQSYEEFKTAVFAALQDKVAERLQSEREHISNSLLLGKMPEDSETETQSNAE